jgi:mRNA-degrading endonuclease RelE of RelBE toxin-antitoxin system
MDVKILTPVNSAIGTLSATERQKVISWFDHLKNWESDEPTRKMAKTTAYQDVFVLNTTDDIRIFFSLDSEKRAITVLDISKPSRFEVLHEKAET